MKLRILISGSFISRMRWRVKNWVHSRVCRWKSGLDSFLWHLPSISSNLREGCVRSPGAPPAVKEPQSLEYSGQTFSLPETPLSTGISEECFYTQIF